MKKKTQPSRGKRRREWEGTIRVVGWRGKKKFSYIIQISWMRVKKSCEFVEDGGWRGYVEECEGKKKMK